MLTYSSQRKVAYITKRMSPNRLLQLNVFHITTITWDNILQASHKCINGRVWMFDIPSYENTRKSVWGIPWYEKQSYSAISTFTIAPSCLYVFHKCSILAVVNYIHFVIWVSLLWHDCVSVTYWQFFEVFFFYLKKSRDT